MNMVADNIIRICHIISGDLWAGAEVMVYNLLKNLKIFENLSLSVILLNEGRLSRELRELGIQVYVVDESKHSFMKILKDTNKILAGKSPDIVHSHRYKENIIAYLSSRYQERIRLVCTQHGMPEYLGNNSGKKYVFLHKANLWLLARSFKKIVAVSNDIQNIFINRFGFSRRLLSVIRNGTEIPEDIRDGGNVGYIVIGSMGRFFPVKDYPFMVKIAIEICKETDKIRFYLAGDGPDMKMIADLIEQYHIENVFHLCGFVENIGEYYKGIDIYMNTSIHEGIPLSILEAMSYGKPIIAPNIGGISEIINNGSEGYLINERDPKIFAEKCLELFENKSLRYSMGAHAREKIEKEFSNERMAQEYYQLYLDLAVS